MTVAKEYMGQVWKDIWEDLVSAYHRKIAKDHADEEGIVANPDGFTNMPGDGEVTYPSDVSGALIPYKVVTDTYDYFESRNYVNDINQQYTQVLTAYDENGKTRETYTYGNERLAYNNGNDTYYYGYTGAGSVDNLTNTAGILETAYSYDAFGNVNVTGNVDTKNPYTYNGEYSDVATGNQFLRARYYSPQTGTFMTEDSYLGDLLEPLSRNLYTYTENNPVNFDDPSGHGIVSWLKNTAKKVVSTVKKVVNTVKKVVNTVKRVVSTVKNAVTKAVSVVKQGYNYAKQYITGSSQQRQQMREEAVAAVGGYVQEHYPSAYEKAQQRGKALHDWGNSKLKEAGNIYNSWTESMEKTVKHFCTTANRIKKGAVEFVKNVDWKKVAIVGAAVIVSTVAVVATGGLAAGAVVGALGLTSGSFGAAVVGGAVVGAIGGTTYSATSSALSGNDAKTVIKDTLVGAGTGAVTGGILGGVGYGAQQLLENSSSLLNASGSKRGSDVVNSADDMVANGNKGDSGAEGEAKAPQYPGNDGTKSPGDGWEWRGNGEPSSGQGSWYNPKTGQTLHPDLEHPEPIGPHWDYKDPSGNWYRLNPDGSLVPK